ncbi:hypothetical protein [Vibrio sonorensis]|nr:hypothetical protein [Vibrio sonorensis]
MFRTTEKLEIALEQIHNNEEIEVSSIPKSYAHQLFPFTKNLAI